MNNSLHDLLLQYQKGSKELKALHRKSELPESRAILGQMAGDMEFVIEWLRTGREPGSRRGIERRSVYELTKVWDPDWFEAFIPPLDAASDYKLSLSDEFNIEEALIGLSERERQCYVLYVGFGYSLRQIASELDITMRTVRTHMERAKVKIDHNKANSLRAFQAFNQEFD